MYYTNINNTEVQQFHKTTNVTTTYNEISSYTNLFNSKDNRKAILFYTDKISGNSNLRILDDKLIIYFNNNDLASVYFSSDNENVEFDLLHEIVTVDNKYYLKLHFYDKDTLFNLAHYKFNITQSNDGISGDYETDIYGNCIIPLTTTTGTFTVTSNNTTRTW